MRGYLFYSAVIGFAIGIFVRSFFDFGYAEILLVLVVSLGVGLIWRRDSGAVASPYLLTLSVFLLCASLGLLRLDYASQSEFNPILESQVDERVALEGVVIREPDIRQFNTHLYVKTEYGLVLVTTDRYLHVSYGDKVVAIGTLEKPEAFETDLGRTFNYPGYLRAHGAEYMMSFANVEVSGDNEGNVILTSLFDFKHAFMQTIESLIPEPQAGLGEGVLLGVKRALGDELEEDFRRTGIIHIVVLSGYNVMIVATAIMLLLTFLFTPRVRMGIGILVITAFALTVGLGATVVRASIMASLVLIARATGRTYAIMRALMLAGVVMLVINPYLLVFDPGFQLSFVATLALILLAPHIERVFWRVPTTFKVREFVTATVSTQLFVLPLLLFSMGQFSVVAVLVNVLVLPMVPFAMLFTFLAGIVGMVSSVLALPFAFLAHLTLSYILIIAEFFGNLPFAAFSVPEFPFWVVVLAYTAMGYAIWRLNHSNWTAVVETPSEYVGISEEKEGEEENFEDYSDWEIEVEVIKSNT